MPDDVSVAEENKMISQLLGEIDEKFQKPEIGDRASQFLDSYIIDNAAPITLRVAVNYLKWVKEKGIPDDDRLKSCICFHGWVEKQDGTVYPCPRCRSEQEIVWWEKDVDEDRMPT